MRKRPSAPKPKPATEAMNYLVEPDVMAKVRAEAKRLHGTKSQVGRLALDRYFELTEAERTR